ncbi:hypothetical protein AMTRI_Chr09g39030 [Amborella trichopoda]|nr:probable protein S-acyltransferase 12 [Amborella trichopoda]XP_011629393.1 probable protein S-acyltransferase 12 [Amborella trichopoda]|eukprot:XP_006830293.2 probable protein S-acyltransferase 12 [Amborella trichopoda]
MMAWNFFKFCSGLRMFGYLMILLVIAIIGASYLAVVIISCGPQLFHGGFRAAISIFILVIFHFLLAMLIWSYCMVVFTDPGSVPENWRRLLDEENPETVASANSSDFVAPIVRSSAWSPSTSMARTSEGGYCGRCQNNKPPRCHHCSVCQRCVLKMDHHCVWVVNCVGAGNYKFFLLFLMYTFLETTLDTLVLLPHFIEFFGEAKNRSGSPGNLAISFLTFVLNLAFALSLLGFLIMHASLLLSNTTTIEVYEKRGVVRWKYDLGRRKNFEQVFGTKKAYWMIPVLSTEDLVNVPALRGLDFPIRSDV